MGCFFQILIGSITLLYSFQQFFGSFSNLLFHSIQILGTASTSSLSRNFIHVNIIADYWYSYCLFERMNNWNCNLRIIIWKQHTLQLTQWRVILYLVVPNEQTLNIFNNSDLTGYLKKLVILLYFWYRKNIFHPQNTIFFN